MLENTSIRRRTVKQPVNTVGRPAEASPTPVIQTSVDRIEQLDLPVVSLASAFAKRSFDVLGALSIAVICSPIILAIAITIRLSGSPILFSHQRVGKDRRMFPCYKFRSMIPDAEQVLQELLRSSPEVLQEWRESHKLRDDPRITEFGAFLRRSSMDELPQLWNVLKGDMSLVGPRPIVEDELERYGNKAMIYMSVKPGMTGLWQIMGRSNVTYSRRVSLDTWYVQKQNILFDAWILMRTAVVVFRRVGAH
jgi:lipopolysaccharide/colanic/teichoic acid biosynthesis glycosyltransferase